MSNFAALLVLVACPTGYGECVREPVRVVSYASTSDCERNLPVEIGKAEKYGMKIHGSCNTVDARLVADRAPIDFTAGPNAYRTARIAVQPTGQATSFSRSLLDEALAERMAR